MTYEIGIVNWSVDVHTHQNVVTNLWQIFHCKCTAQLPAEFSGLNQITNLIMTFDLSRNIMLSQITQIYIILLACIKGGHGFHCMKVWNHCTMVSKAKISIGFVLRMQHKRLIMKQYVYVSNFKAWVIMFLFLQLLFFGWFSGM